MRFLLFTMSLLSQFYAMPVLANSGNQLATAIATSASRFGYDSETNYCGGEVISYKVVKNNSSKVTVSAILSAQKGNCAKVSFKKCTITYSKSEAVLQETAFNCKS